MEDNNNKLEKKIDYIYKMLTKEEKFNNKTIHIGIMCNKCGINPIIGYRYKCSICKDYELSDKEKAEPEAETSDKSAESSDKSKKADAKKAT